MNKSEQLIACLEGEIAKRDARIVELEADLAGTQSRVLVLQDQWRQIDAELAAIKAQGVVMPERWNVPRPMWKDARQPYGNPLNHADIEAAEKFNLALDEVARLNAIECAACVSDGLSAGMSQDEAEEFAARLNAAPVQQVSDDELLEAACHQGNGNKARRRAEAIAAQAHIGSVTPNADGYVRPPVEPTEAMVFAGCAALVGSIGGYEAGLVERCYEAMLYAAQASPAADAWIPVSERLPEPFTVVALLDDSRWMNTGSDDFEANWTSAGWMNDCSSRPYWAAIGEPRGLVLEAVTHWMPLPAAPALSTTEGQGDE